MEENNNGVLEEKSNNKVSRFLVCLLFILALVGALYYFVVKPQRDKKPTITTPTNEEVVPTDEVLALGGLAGLTKEDTNDYNNKYTFYYNDTFDDAFYWCDKKCKNKVTVKVKSTNIYDKGVFKNKYIYFVDDDTFKVYDINTKDTYAVNSIVKMTKDNKRWVIIEANENTDELLGLIYMESDKGLNSYFSFKLNKFLYDKKYFDVRVIDDNYLEAKEGTCSEYSCSADKIVLLSTKEERVLDEIKYTSLMEDNGLSAGYNVLKNPNNDKYYIYKYVETESDDILNENRTIYTSNLKEIASDINKYYVTVNKDGNLVIARDNEITIYDSEGNTLKTTIEEQVEMVIYDYIVTGFLDDERVLGLYTFDGESVVIGEYDARKQMIDFEKSYMATYNKSGVKDVDSSKFVIYIVVDDKVYYYIPSTGKKGTTTLSSKK